MKSQKRQSGLLIGAVACIAIVAWQLLFSGKENTSSASLKPADASTTSSAPVVETGGTGSTDPPLTPALYEKASKELQAIFPDNPQPFRSGDMILEMGPSQTNSTLLPLGFDGNFTALPTEDGKPVKRTAAQPDEVAVGPPSRANSQTDPAPATETKTEIVVPRLKGLVRGTDSHEIQALLEVNGSLVTATAEELAEWRIIEQTNDSITVQHGQHIWVIDLNKTAEAQG